MSPSQHPCATVHPGRVQGSAEEAVEPEDPTSARHGSAWALPCWAGRKRWTTPQLYKLLLVAHAELPRGRAWITFLFSLGKTLWAAGTCHGRLQKPWYGGLPLPFLPIPSSPAQLLHIILAFRPAEEHAAGWLVGCSWRSWALLAAGLTAELAIFSFPSCCLCSHPKSTAAIRLRILRCCLARPSYAPSFTSASEDEIRSL